MAQEQQPQFDYVVVGSGGGGGPVAANLASAGFKVLLIEAGDEHENLSYQVPAFHGQATEDPEMRWDFFVQHYSAPERNTDGYDSKYVTEKKGVLYPRAGTLGGCTGHHALITLYPHNSDWEEISRIAKTYDPTDESWAPDRMRRIFERIERCGYLGEQGPKDVEARHGFSGWLTTEVLTDLIDPEALLDSPDLQLLQTVIGAVHATIWDVDFNPHDPKSLGRLLDRLESTLERAPNLKQLFKLQPLVDKKAELEAHVKGSLNQFLDPNDYRVTLEHREGVFLIPISVSPDERKRVGTRERIKQVKARFPENLTIWCNSFVTRIVFEGNKAVGVEYVNSQKYYDAAREDRSAPPRNEERKVERVKREVVVAGGSFNTPQLLMLSGIGPKEQVEKYKIKSVIDLPAVGGFLQDRYELGFISEAPKNYTILSDYLFREPKPGEKDAALDQWKATHNGLYATNGAVLCVIRKSSHRADENPDLFIFGLPAAFKGYFPGYADTLEQRRNRFTWAILKGHTRNKGGYVRLKSSDPFERPEINFKYFDEGTDEGGDDLAAMVEGVDFVRRFTSHLGLHALPLVAQKKKHPPDMNDGYQISEWVKQEAWGHHACGTCRIGPKDKPDEAALDADFKVRGAEGLRVVDASVFPSIPGFFIVTPIYMIAEKASESILKDAGWKPRDGGQNGLNLPEIG
ncbi:GMC family oxidoreductase [Paludisphaera borealis]|uniref:Putative GMC-type oxidoreductase n=1 Tax=Paludisphaera borealis TaxID=1387353 RepID=A0A1U7CLA2_9BACT|nr:GMC family oxidoreductase [Paludisphaera borealis]APW59715.1 putative GMC-type oxidoreductase [Paludisphaera borealis]